MSISLLINKLINNRRAAKIDKIRILFVNRSLERGQFYDIVLNLLFNIMFLLIDAFPDFKIILIGQHKSGCLFNGITLSLMNEIIPDCCDVVGKFVGKRVQCKKVEGTVVLKLFDDACHIKRRGLGFRLTVQYRPT